MYECDLIMKGGITSGVVYPEAIAEIARDYRLRSIGGTSAGAIGAVMAAAAEYRRQEPGKEGDFAGFEAVRGLASELGEDLQSLFQPAPRLKPLFDILLAQVGRGTRPVWLVLLKAAIRAYPGRSLIGMGIGLVIAILGYQSGSDWTVVVGIAAGIVLTAVLIGAALATAILRDLPAADFGLCPGIRTSGSARPGFTDWIADHIDRIAGKTGEDGSLGDPLTVGQLAARQVGVATMTTDLSSGRPYQLPLKSRHHLFSRSEMARLLPGRVVDYLVRAGAPHEHSVRGLPDDLYWLPTGDAFPVVLVARMSLSFPGLISAVPLYRYDDQLRVSGTPEAKIRRCLFSDGGISSNFPIHFFDALLPRRPTFGISLTSWEQPRHGEDRVHLPTGGRQSTDIPIRPVNDILGFLFSIVNTAKDWQDTLQSLLPGYAERIVEIRLDDSKEGGLNLNMDKETIDRLSEYGREAGRMLTGRFNINEHRYLRTVTLLKTTEEALEGLATAYSADPAKAGPDARAYPDLFANYTPKTKPNSKTWRRDVLGGFAKALADLGEAARENNGQPGKKSVRNGDLPKFDAKLRVIATADRAPEARQSSAPADVGSAPAADETPTS